MNEPNPPEKNLHASIPNALLMEAVKIAAAQHMTVDELVREAVERRLRDIQRERLYMYGQEQARKLGIREEDVEGIIHQHREENKKRGR